MKQLSITDAAFLYMETERMPMTIAGLQLLELPPERQATFVDELKALFEERKHLVPYLTNKVRFLPGNFDQPVWEKDQNFDINNHISVVDLGGNATIAEVEDTIARLHEQRLPRDRPLWRLVVITGIENNRIGYYNAVHHACVDGMGGQAAMLLLMDMSPEPAKTEPPVEKPEPDVSAAGLVIGAFEKLATSSLESWTQFPQTMKTAARLLSRAIDPDRDFGALGQGAPKISFNTSIGSKRTYAVGRLPLIEIKSIARALECSVNDLFMAITSEALRTYLGRRDELPDESLVAGIPVSLRAEGDTTTNNQVGMMTASLATDIADPRERIAAIRASANVGKALSRDLNGGSTAEVHVFGLPWLLQGAGRMLERFDLADRIAMPMNLVISNVIGPRYQLYSNGARVLTQFPVSIPTHGNGLNLTVQSYLDYMDFSITAGEKAMTDPRQFRDDMIRAFFDLRGEVLGKPGVVTGWDATRELEPAKVKAVASISDAA
jgi:WS/DGAT/MGAT family acyltransferase